MLAALVLGLAAAVGALTPPVPTYTTLLCDSSTAGYKGLVISCNNNHIIGS